MPFNYNFPASDIMMQQASFNFVCLFRRRCIREGRLHCELVNKPWSSKLQGQKSTDPQKTQMHITVFWRFVFALHFTIH